MVVSLREVNSFGRVDLICAVYDENEMAAFANRLKVNSPQFCRVLQQMNISTPSIHVTSFDDDAYNEKMQRKLDDPTWAELEDKSKTESAEAMVENSLDDNKNKQESGLCFANGNANGNDGVSKNGSHEEEKTTMLESHEQTVKSHQPSTNEGSEVSSHTPTEIEDNQVETKKDNLNKQGATEQLKTSVSRKARKTSWSSSDTQRNGLIKNPSPPRRRYTVGSVSGDNKNYNGSQNNSNLNKRRSVQSFGSTPLNSRLITGENKHSTEIMINKKKSERIDLSFKIDPRKRPQTCGELARIENNSGDTTLDKGSRRFDGDHRAVDNVHSAPAGSPPRSPKVPVRKISENSLSILKNAGVTTNTDENYSLSSPMRRVSTSIIERTNSPSNSRARSEADKRIAQSLNLASPPQTRKFSSPKPPSGERHAQLPVRANRSLSKSDLDLRKIGSEEETVEVGRPVSVSSPPHPRRASSSLGISVSLSMSKSETDLRKLVSDEEEMERRGSLSAHSSPRMLRRSSNCQIQKSAPTCPVTPQQERKIFMAAAKQEARLPTRAKARNDLQATSQLIIEQAEKELNKFTERLPHISMEQVMKTWQITNSRHWNMVSTVVNPHAKGKGSGTNMEEVKDCRYVRESVVMQKKKKFSH